MAKVIQATANEVRDFFEQNQKKVPAGDKTVGRPASEHRGRLSAAAREVFEKETGKVYVPPSQGGPVKGAVALTFSYTQPSGRTAKKTEMLTVKEIRTLAGDAAKSKGRLTDAAIEAAATARGAQVTAESKANAKAKRAPKAAKPAPQEQAQESTDSE